MKATFGEKMFQTLNYVFLFAAAVTMLFPLLQLLAVSLSSPVAADSKEVFLLPVEFTTASWEHVLKIKACGHHSGLPYILRSPGRCSACCFRS